MYSGYTTATLTLRAKVPFSYHHLSLYNDRVESCRWDCVPSAGFSIHGLPINPRFLYSYYLRQSTLIHWSRSRSFLSGGAAAGARYCRLPLHDRRPAPSKERGRCGGSWASRRARDPDGSYGEMIGLLADVECCYQEESIGFKCAGVRSELGRSGRISEGEVKIKSVDGDCRRSLRRKDLGRVRKDGSSSSYYSVASSSVSGDSEPKGGRCRRVAGEYRNGYSKYGFEANRVDTVEKEVQEVRKYGDSAWSERRHTSGQDVGWDTRGEFKRWGSNGRATGPSSKKESEWEIWDKKEKDASLMDHAHEAREGYIREVQPNVGQRDLREGKRDLREGSRKLTVTSEICEDDTKRASNFKNMVDARKRSREVSSATFVNLHSQIDQRAVGSTELRSSQKLNEKFEIHGSNIRRDSDSKKNLQETRLKERLDASTSVQNLVVAREKRIQPEQQAVDKVASNQQHKNRSNVSQIHESDIEKLSRSQILDESRLDDREYDPISAVHLVHGAREQQNQINERVKHQYSSRRSSEKNTRLSELSRSEIEGASNSQEISNSRVEHEGHSTSVIDLIRGSREQQNRADDCVDSQYSSRGASERDTKLSEFSSSKVERVSSSHGTSITRIGNQKQTSSVQDKKDKQKSTLSKEYSQSEKAQKEFTRISDGSSSFLYKHIHELGDQTSRDVAYQSKDDKLESASRLDSSSALYVGEFVDMLRQEISTLVELDNTSNLSSEIRSEEVQERTSQTTTDIHFGVLDAATSSKDETYVQESARQSSSRSGVKGPSDEMWDVRGTYSQEPSRAKEHEDSSAVRVEESTTAPARTENSITRRTPRSLWTYIADIVRAGWGLRAESRNSTPKSGTRSSSNESVSSEAWFSGHEPDEKDDDETEKKGISSAPKGPVQTKRPVDPSHRRTLSFPSQGSSEASRPGDMRTLAEASSSTSTGSIKRNQPSKGASPVSKPVEFQWTEGEKGRRGIPSSVVTIDHSSASTGGTVSSTVEEKITEIGNAQTAGASFLKLEEELVREKPPEVGLTDGKDGELKRRKLQRNKQVLKEQFDEWEEAYNREREQRKMDEYFMREALLEAKKAADTWEVPVGAVLVKNGNIIARGCNLVEELRDSTAHAEMICIREASNLLRTWRLAETTLYVTLEPCAMCAGAILQARIDTVVWGAPNRLLGADGSWVRLFPSEDGGSNDLDPSNPRAGPVHPFHPKMTIRRGILATECSDVMQRFFQLRRKKKMEPPPPPPPPSCLPISTHPSKLVTKMHNIFSTMFCL